MKKSTKTILAGLAALPIAVLAGCGPKPATVDAFAKNPHSFGNRYPTQTTISNADSFGTGIIAPTTAAGVVKSVSNMKNGQRIIVMTGVTQAEYEAYSEQVNPTTLTVAETEEESDFYELEYIAETETLQITYCAADAEEDSGLLEDYRLNAVLNASSNSVYMKYAMDMSGMFPDYEDEEDFKQDNAEELEDYTDAEIHEMYLTYLDAVANSKMTYEIATRVVGESDSARRDYAVAMYMDVMGEKMDVRATIIDGSVYYVMHAPAEYGEPETKAYGKLELSKLSDEARSQMGLDSLDFSVTDFVEQDKNELNESYVASGYDMVNGKVYYFEEFVNPEEDDLTMRYYFNGSDLLYVASVQADMLIEVKISNTVPTHMFETRVPSGYLDMSAALQNIFYGPSQGSDEQ